MPFETEVRVRFAETDAQGIAHHAAYLVWFELARIDYLARFDGGYPALREQGVEATTMEVYARYARPARFDETLVVACRCSELRGARFRFDYTVTREGEAVADGWSTHACVDAVTLRPIRIPDWLLAAITESEAAEGAARPAAAAAEAEAEAGSSSSAAEAEPPGAASSRT